MTYPQRMVRTGEILDEMVSYFDSKDESILEETGLPRIAIVESQMLKIIID